MTVRLALSSEKRFLNPRWGSNPQPSADQWLERLTGHQKVAGLIPVSSSEVVFLRLELDESSSIIHCYYYYCSLGDIGPLTSQAAATLLWAVPAGIGGVSVSTSVRCCVGVLFLSFILFLFFFLFFFFTLFLLFLFFIHFFFLTVLFYCLFLPFLVIYFNSFTRSHFLRSWSPDRTLSQARKYIAEALGPAYAEGVILDLEKTWEESDERTPLICFLSMGSDPTNAIESLAKRHKLGRISSSSFTVNVL